jgi:hypothetical protein
MRRKSVSDTVAQTTCQSALDTLSSYYRKSKLSFRIVEDMIYKINLIEQFRRIMHQFQAEFLKIAEGNGKEMERLGEIEREYYAVFEQPAEMKDFDAVYENAAEIQRILCENFKVEKGKVEVNSILSLQKAIRMIVREFQGNFKRCSCIVSLKVVFDTVGDMLEEIEKLIADKNNTRKD